MSTTVDPEFTDAKDVSDYLLEVTRQGHMTRDFSIISERFLLPQTIGTFEGDQRLETTADLRVIFDNMCALLDSRQVIDIQRKTLAAAFIAPDRVRATFVNQHVLPNFVLGEEVVAHGTLLRVDGLWRVEESRYATSMDEMTRALTPNPAKPAHLQR